MAYVQLKRYQLLEPTGTTYGWVTYDFKNVANVTQSINGKPLADIFESDGLTVKNAIINWNN